MSGNKFYLSELQGVPVNTDATEIIQSAINAARHAGGGIVEIPAGFFIVRGLTIRSRVMLKGQGDSATTLKLADNSNCNVIETENFVEDIKQSKKWLVEDGMNHGFSVRDLRIHGNKVENTKGHGLAIYGKRYTLDNLTILYCAQDGLFTQGPDVGGQSHIDDIPEAKIHNLHIHLCRGNGINYRGPHDGFIESAVIGECHGIGVITETETGKFNGAVDFGRLHVYSCQQGIRIGTAATTITKLVADTNYQQGVIVDAHRVQIGQLWAFRNWRPGTRGDLRSEDTRKDATVEINQTCQIGTATIRTDFGGTGIKINGFRTQIGSCLIECENPRGEESAGIGLDIHANLVRATGDIRGFTRAGSIGLRVNHEKPFLMTTLDFTIVDCATGFVDGHGGDTQDWRIKIQTGENQKGFCLSGKNLRSSIQIMSRGKDYSTHMQLPVEPKPVVKS